MGRGLVSTALKEHRELTAWYFTVLRARGWDLEITYQEMCLHEGLRMGNLMLCYGCIMAADSWVQEPGLRIGQGRHLAWKMSVEHRAVRFRGRGTCRGLRKVLRSPVPRGGSWEP